MVNYNDPILPLRGILLGVLIGAAMWVIGIWLVTLL